MFVLFLDENIKYLKPQKWEWHEWINKFIKYVLILRLHSKVSHQEANYTLI